MPRRQSCLHALELLFDLVFVFALTKVSSLLARDLSWIGVLRGCAVLAAIWWAWAGYAWLTNAVGIDQDIAFRLRNMRSLNRQRLVVAALFLLLIPVSYQLSSLVVLAMATGVLVALVAYEAIRFREARHQPRAHGPAE